MKKAIVYIDLSERSKKIVEYVMNLRRFIPLEVHLVYNINIYDYAFQPAQCIGMYPEGKLETMVLDDRNQIKQQAHRFIEESSCWGKTDLKEKLKIETGPLFEMIKTLKTTNDTFVVVPEIDESMVLDKLNTYENFDLIEDLEIPILIVPNNYKFQMFNSLIFVTNFHDEDFDAIRFINKLALPINAPIHVVHVTGKKDDLVQGRMRQLKNRVTVMLEDNAKNISYEVILSKHNFKTIQEIAEMRKAGLVVFQEFLLKFMLGKSFSNGTMEASKLPVLIYNKM